MAPVSMLLARLMNSSLEGAVIQEGGSVPAKTLLDRSTEVRLLAASGQAVYERQ